MNQKITLASLFADQIVAAAAHHAQHVQSNEALANNMFKQRLVSLLKLSNGRIVPITRPGMSTLYTVRLPDGSVYQAPEVGPIRTILSKCPVQKPDNRKQFKKKRHDHVAKAKRAGHYDTQMAHAHTKGAA